MGQRWSWEWLPCALNNYVFQVHPARGGNTSLWLILNSDPLFCEALLTLFPPENFTPFTRNCFESRTLAISCVLVFPPSAWRRETLYVGGSGGLRRFGTTKRRKGKDFITQPFWRQNVCSLCRHLPKTVINSRNLKLSIGNF